MTKLCKFENGICIYCGDTTRVNSRGETCGGWTETDNSQPLLNALAEIELLQTQLASELAAHESWQNEHLRIDGEQCRQIRELEMERDAALASVEHWKLKYKES